MEWNKFPKEPIIIGGCGRSGTTLLLSVLGSHPNIFTIPDETQAFCPGAYDINPEFLQKKDTIKISRDRLFELRMKSLDTKRPFNISIINSYLKDTKAEHGRWCEKTPKNILFIDKILDFFKEKIKFIHIVRDGRDVVTSVHPGRNTFHIPFQRWITEVSKGLEYKNDSRVYTLKYENLIQDFHHETEKLCDFIGEPFNAQMSRWHENTSVKEHNSFHGENVTSLYKNAIGRWKSPEYNERISLFLKNQQALKCLEELGYLR